MTKGNLKGDVLKILENSLHLFSFIFKPCKVLTLPHCESINSISLLWKKKPKTKKHELFLRFYRSKLLDQSM